MQFSKILNIFLSLVVLFVSSFVFDVQAQAFWPFKKKKKEKIEQVQPLESDSQLEEIKEEFVTKEVEQVDPKTLVKEIFIEGNSIIDKQQILDVMETKKGSKFISGNIKQDLKKVYEMGYFTKNMKALPQKTDEGVILKVLVQENIPITSFTIQGNTVIDNVELLEIVNENIGLPQNIVLLNDIINKIENLYSSKGYVLARVKNIVDEPDGNVSVSIDEGVIEKIKIKGNYKTKEFVIARNMMVKEGDIYNEIRLRDDLKRVFGLRAFADVRRVIAPGEIDPDKYLLTVEVDEKRSGSISIGGGFDTAAGMFGSAGFTDYNFRGLGQHLGLNLMTGSGMVFRNSSIIRRASYQLEAKFFEPHYKQTKNSLLVTAFARDFASWQVPLAIEKRIGGEVQVMRPLDGYPHLSGGVTVGIEGISMKEGDAVAAQAVYNQAGENFSQRANQLVGGTFISLGPKLVYDTRDDMFNPRSGIYSTLGVKQYVSIGGASSFGKLDGVIQRYFPVGEKSAFALMLKAGGGLNGTLPAFAEYSLGGIRSIRGYRQTEAGSGAGMVMTTAEFRTPIPFVDRVTKNGFLNNIRLVTFLDAGQVFKKNFTNTLYDYPGYGISTGMGLRIQIPGLGPVKLDYGYPLTNLGGGKIGLPRGKSGRFTFDIGETY